MTINQLRIEDPMRLNFNPLFEEIFSIVGPFLGRSLRDWIVI